VGKRDNERGTNKKWLAVQRYLELASVITSHCQLLYKKDESIFFLRNGEKKEGKIEGHPPQ
jgi:hypothetical protein